MNVNDPYYLNLLINLALLAIGAAAGYFTAKRNGQKDAIALKNELIKDFKEKVEQLEKEVEKLKNEKQAMQSTLDDLVAIEEARKRLAQKTHRALAAPKKEEV